MSERAGRWAMLGESVVAFVHGARIGVPLPPAMHRLPGPLVVVAERFIESPVGPFSVLSVGVPVRLGMRPAFHYAISVVSSADARRSGRTYWGFPHQLGTLNWRSDSEKTQMRWEEQEFSLEAVRVRRPVPFLVPIRSVQVRGDGPVVVPEWSRGIARRAHIEISCADEGPAAMLHGQFKGFCVSGLRINRSSARLPWGNFSSLRAPIRTPDPGVAGMGRRRPSTRV